MSKLILGALFLSILNFSPIAFSESAKTISNDKAAPRAAKLKISPVSISVVGLSQVEFTVKGGVPPYKCTATSGSLSRGKSKVTLFTPEYETTIYITVEDSQGEKTKAEVFVSKPHSED